MSESSSPSSPSANIVGLGLIGGSLALALRAKGWLVHGEDADSDRESRALREGFIDEIGRSPSAWISVVATPVDSVVDLVRDLLRTTDGAVTDVASVKAAITEAIDSDRFVGGHPMAGSEMDGLDGADGAMFERAAWVLTPASTTADTTFATVAEMARVVGAEVVVMAPELHDALVAVTSHVPHLVAASLMCQAEERSSEALSLPRLAAGGFRDMTRVASGRPDIWRSICQRNASAIDDALGDLVDRLERVRLAVRTGEMDEVMSVLDEARRARRSLVPIAVRIEDSDELRVPIADRPGSAAEIFTIAADLGVNVHDFDITHSAEGSGGVVTVVVSRDQSGMLRGGLLARGYRPTVNAAV